MGRIVWEQPGGSAGVSNWLAAASGIAAGMADTRLRQGAADLEQQQFDRRRVAAREDQAALLDRQIPADQRRMQMQEGIDLRRMDRESQNLDARNRAAMDRITAQDAYKAAFRNSAADGMLATMGQGATPEFRQAVEMFRQNGDESIVRQAMTKEQQRQANVEAAAPLRSLVTREGPPTLQDDALVRGVEAGQFDLNDAAVRARMGLRTESETLAGEREARLRAQAAERQQMKQFMTAEEKLRIDQLEQREQTAREAYRLIVQANQFQTPEFFAPFQKAMADASQMLDAEMTRIRQRLGGMVPGQAAPTLPPMANPQPPQTLDPAAAQSLGVAAPTASAPLGLVASGPNKGKAVGSPGDQGGYVLPSGRIAPNGVRLTTERQAALAKLVEAGTVQRGSVNYRAEYLRLMDEQMAESAGGLMDRVWSNFRGQ